MRTCLIAPLAFKGTYSAQAIAGLIQKHLETTAPAVKPPVQLVCCPLADGGTDTLAVLEVSQQKLDAVEHPWQSFQASVIGPVPEQTVEARFLWHRLKKIVVIEAAQAHGMQYGMHHEIQHLDTPNLGDPLSRTSYGVGQLMREALKRIQPLPSSMVVTLGGSASTDGGMGALQAMGTLFYDKSGKVWKKETAGIITSEEIFNIQRIELPIEPLNGIGCKVATDVTNPLLGEQGAARVYGPQKGADPSQVDRLEAAMAYWAGLLQTATRKDLTCLPGAGAAGGLGFALCHLPHAKQVSGFDWLADMLELSEKIAAADVIITGEGRLDHTSLQGKGVGEIIRRSNGKPVWVVCGQQEPDLSLPSHVKVIELEALPTLTLAHLLEISP